MSERTSAGTWLDRVAGLLGRDAKGGLRVRRLAAEPLEKRNVLCVVAEPVINETTPDDTSLAALDEQAALMGPVAPTSSTGVAADPTGDTVATSDPGTDDPVVADQFFATYAGEGEGVSSGSGSGVCGASGSGGGAGVCSGSGSGIGECSGSGSGAGIGSGSGSGSGVCSGSGSGASYGSGSGTGETSCSSGGVNQAPAVSVGFEEIGGILYFSGTVSDDGIVGGLTVCFGDLIVQNVVVNPDGTFSFQVSAPELSGTFSFSVTDDHGLSSGVNYENYSTT